MSKKTYDFCVTLQYQEPPGLYGVQIIVNRIGHSSIKLWAAYMHTVDLHTKFGWKRHKFERTQESADTHIKDIAAEFSHSLNVGKKYYAVDKATSQCFEGYEAKKAKKVIINLLDEAIMFVDSDIYLQAYAHRVESLIRDIDKIVR